jgi:EAL domain-containing protein (putative c-di-GMP-specific phosphodiesterase class I)
MAKETQQPAEQPGETTEFLKQMDNELLGWEEPEARLRQALDEDQFCLFAQPIQRLSDKRDIAMVEVLVRLREEEALMLPPGDFLPAFEHYGMMAELDRWVVKHALKRLAGGGPIDTISVNVSGQAITDPAFVPYVAAQLKENRLKPSALVIEVGEADSLDRAEASAKFAAAAKAIGCRLMLDGFAQRSVSFDALKLLKVDFVKVDGSVIRKITRSGSAITKLKAVVRVGEMTGIGVVAECVEEEKVRDALKLLKVGYVQGFGVAKPQPIEELVKK